MADPGFPVGGMDLVGRAWTPEVVTFRKFCMSKRKNLDPWGGVRRAMKTVSKGKARYKKDNQELTCLFC